MHPKDVIVSSSLKLVDCLVLELTKFHFRLMYVLQDNLRIFITGSSSFLICKGCKIITVSCHVQKLVFSLFEFSKKRRDIICYFSCSS